MSNDAVAASAKGATFLILLQIGSRGVTFALNQVLLRFLSPQLLGTAVQLELYIISTLYFSRESFRIATQRRSDGGVQAAINLSYLAVAAGPFIALLFAQAYLSSGYPDVPYVITALRINGLAAMIELVSEPAFVAVQQNMLYKTRAAAEASAVVVKTFATAGLVFWGHHKAIDLGVLPFAVGELAYSSTLTVVYLFRTAPVAHAEAFSLLPRTIAASHGYVFGLFSKPLLYLSASLYLQTGIKWLLTEGDKILISAFATLEDQGTYAISANYGGLLARMLFRPIEDSSRNLFANLCSDTKEDVAKEALMKQDKAEPVATSKQKAEIQQAASILHDILKVYYIGSLVVIVIGPTAAPVLLRLVAGSRWTSSGAGDVLSIYCFCIPLLAINGVSEAFVSATASTKQLQRQSMWMGGFSAGFAISAYVFLRVLKMGAIGLVLANCVNMILRIVFNLYYSRDYFQQRGVQFDLTDLLPSSYAVAVSCGIMTMWGLSSAPLYGGYGILGELVQLGGIAAVFVLVIAALERDFLLGCYRKFRA